MRIRGHVCEMAQSEILQYVPASVYEEIKKTDDHPEFRAYAIGHEGESSGPISIGGKKFDIVKRWLRTAIEKLYSKIQIGTPAYHLHANTNETEGRRSIGKIVGKAMETIAGKLTTIAITYINPQFRKMDLDVASIEADIELTENGQSLDVVGIDAVTGVALANSNYQRPGFPGASLLAAVEEFAGGNNMTIDEVKAFLVEKRIRPSELFSTDVLLRDPVVESGIVEATKTEYAHRKRIEDKFKDASAEWENEKKKMVDDMSSLKKGALQGKIKERFDAIVASRKLDEKQSKFLADIPSQVSVDDESKIDNALNPIIDAGLKKFNETAQLFGMKVLDGGNGKGTEQKAESTQAPIADTEDALVKASPTYKDLTT